MKSNEPVVMVSITAANTEAANPMTIPWHWIKARLLRTIEVHWLRESRLPRLACAVCNQINNII